MSTKILILMSGEVDVSPRELDMVAEADVNVELRRYKPIAEHIGLCVGAVADKATLVRMQKDWAIAHNGRK